MLAKKAVRQNYEPSIELESILGSFREMVNYCIIIGLEKGITSRFRLSNEVYRDLHNGLHTWYILSAVEKASAILKNYRKSMRKNPKTKRPYVRKPFLSIGNQAYKIVGGQLRLPTKPRQFIYIPLNKHTLDVLSEPSLKLGSITLTASTLSIAFSKETAEMEPTGYMGLDRNLNNLTLATSEGENKSYDLSECNRIKSSYRTIKSHFKRNDVRLRSKVFRKYGLKERNKVNQILHKISKEIVEKAKVQNYGIVMEKLTGIRKLYHRGNGQGRDYRAKLNSWSYAELQKQIEYKAKWEGIKVIYVSAKGTSATCSICGSKTYPNGQRTLFCPKCSIVVDRDVNAARNVLARGLRFGPIALPGEAMVLERGKPIQKVDGSELSLVPKT